MSPELAPLTDGSLLATMSEGWAYVTLAATGFWGSEFAPLLSGFAAEQGHLVFSACVAAIASGVWAWVVGLYFVGRWRAAWVRLNVRKAPPLVRSVLSILRSNPWRSTVLARFLFGGRILLPLACGASRVPIWIFLTGTAIAAVSWATIYAALGWFFGQSAVAILGHVKTVEEIIAALVLVGIAVAIFYVLRRRQKKGGSSDVT